MRTWRVFSLATMLSFLSLRGVVPAAEDGAPQSSADDNASNVEKPLMFSEAKLPEGFPPPGPVDRVVLKSYPAHRLARVSADGGSNGMFMKLFRHIERNEISMTAPVEMTWNPGAEEVATRPAGEPARMAFLYGSSTIGATGPDPDDAQVMVEDVPAMKVVSVGIRGAYDAKGFSRGYDMLAHWLAEHPEWKPAGPARTLGYNSPFVPVFARFSEVQIPIVAASE